MSRHQKARRLALQGLCCLDAQGSHVLDLIDGFIADSREGDEVVEEAQFFMRKVHAQWDEVDRFLTRHARHWELRRLALVDRNILRICVYEMIHEAALSHRNIISDGLKLAKEFSSAESPRFVNGVLDAVSREVRNGHKPDSPPADGAAAADAPEAPAASEPASHTRDD